MATPLPIVRGTSAALYPFSITFTAQTGKSDGQNATPTRWVKGPPLVSLELPTSRITQAQKNTLKSFFTSSKGQFETDLSVTTYMPWTNLSFDDDEFTAAEAQSTRYGSTWKLSQTLPQNFAPGSPVAAYPQLVAGSLGKLPYTQKKRFQTMATKMQSGPKYVYAEFGGGLTGFPTDGLMAWELAQSNLLETEVNTLLAHFLTNWGDALPFTFEDEDSVVYSNVYYASPELRIEWTRLNGAAIKTSLIQMF